MNLINKKSITEIIKYAFLSIVGYGFVFLFLFLFIELFQFNTSYSFLIVYGSWYIMLYSLQLRFLFNTTHSKKRFLKFCFYLIVFYVIANVLFNLGLYFNQNYLVATLITILVLMPLRFLTTKYYVYK
jgi:hypothetical protein